MQEKCLKSYKAVPLKITFDSFHANARVVSGAKIQYKRVKLSKYKTDPH